MTGFDAVTDIGDSLEQAAADQDTERLRGLVDALSSYMERIQVVYR